MVQRLMSWKRYKRIYNKLYLHNILFFLFFFNMFKYRVKFRERPQYRYIYIYIYVLDNYSSNYRAGEGKQVTTRNLKRIRVVYVLVYYDFFFLFYARIIIVLFVKTIIKPYKRLFSGQELFTTTSITLNAHLSNVLRDKKKKNSKTMLLFFISRQWVRVLRKLTCT